MNLDARVMDTTKLVMNTLPSVGIFMIISFLSPCLNRIIFYAHIRMIFGRSYNLRVQKVITKQKSIKSYRPSLYALLIFTSELESTHITLVPSHYLL